MKKLKIDNEFKNLIPPLTKEEYKQLEENLINEGCRDSLVVWNDVIIDGHNRHEICIKNIIPFSIKEMDFENRQQVIEWIIKNQFGRRNLPAYERAKLALKLKPVIAERAKENQLASQNNKQSAVHQKSDKQIETSKELAKIAGVSHDTIHKVEVIENNADDNTKQQVQKGDISINQAYILTKSVIETKKKNEENELALKQQLEKEKQEREEKLRIEEIQKTLPQNAVFLDKFRKTEETHIFGITDFKNLTETQFNDCLKHCKKYQDTIHKVAMLSDSADSLKAWDCILESQEEVELELNTVNNAIQILCKIQNYFKGVKKNEKSIFNEES